MLPFSVTIFVSGMKSRCAGLSSVICSEHPTPIIVVLDCSDIRPAKCSSSVGCAIAPSGLNSSGSHMYTSHSVDGLSMSWNARAISPCAPNNATLQCFLFAISGRTSKSMVFGEIRPIVELFGISRSR